MEFISAVTTIKVADHLTTTSRIRAARLNPHDHIADWEEADIIDGMPAVGEGSSRFARIQRLMRVDPV
jgi:hypothetical protein